MKTRLVLLGPPASGKGTQAELISARFGLPTASPGAMLREERAAGTELGTRAAEYTEKGLLAPDDLILGVVSHWLDSNRDRGFVFDGFPRTRGQADALDGLLETQRQPIQAVFTLDAPAEILEQRVDRRLVCLSCGAIFAAALEVRDARESCPRCGGKLGHRPDDTRETLRLRLEQYAAKSEPLIAFYQARGVLYRIDAARPAAVVSTEIAAVIEQP